MKVIHIINELKKGGAGRLCLDIVRYSNALEGVEAKLITFNKANDFSDEYPDINPVVVDAFVKLSVTKPNKTYIQELQGFLEEFSPDIIHTHLFETELVSRSCHLPKALWFSHCHDNMVQFRNLGVKTLLSKQALTNFYEKRFLFQRYATIGGNHFIAISQDTQAYFSKTAKPYFVTLLHNAIDNMKFTNPKPKIKKDNILRLINVGSFLPNKNQSFLLEVVKILNEKNLPVELHLVGDGASKSQLKERTSLYGLDQHIRFHGSVNNVEKFLWTADIYIHSAHSEGLSLTTLEAMAAGLPVITLDGKGNRDLIVQGKNGFMLMERDAEKFADKIVEIWENKSLSREMATYAQEFAKGYDIKEYVCRLLEIYRKAI